MRKRILGGVVAASAALMLFVPTGSQADVESTCQTGKESVVTVGVNGSPLVKATVRGLCIQDPD